MSTANGILTQSASSILDDVEGFYFGGAVPWFQGDQRNAADPRLIDVTMWDPGMNEESGATQTYTVSAGRIKDAFFHARKQGCQLCCAENIATEQLGGGCAQDLDVVLQVACYGAVVFG